MYILLNKELNDKIGLNCVSKITNKIFIEFFSHYSHFFKQYSQKKINLI